MNNTTNLTPPVPGAASGSAGTSSVSGLGGAAGHSAAADLARSAAVSPESSRWSPGKGSTSEGTSNASGSTSLWQSVKEFDNQRESLPGEHWVTLAAGLVLFMASRRSRSLLFRTLGPVVGGALVMRAASGRDGIEKLVRYLPLR